MKKMSAKEAAEKFGNVSVDSACEIRDDKVCGERLTLRICGVGDDAFFERINALGDPDGDIFYEAEITEEDEKGVPDPEQEGDDGTEDHDTDDRNPNRDGVSTLNGMNNYVVLYRDEHIMSPLDAPFGFQCWADNADHAEEQCENAYPGCGIVWVWHGPTGVGMQPALDEYYGNEGETS